MEMWKVGIALTFCSLLASGAESSVDIPLTWNSVHIATPDRGGAEVRAATNENGQLARLTVSIREKEVAIPQRCLKGLTRPYLNALKISYGQSVQGEEYWSIDLPFDGTGSAELGAVFTLVFSDDRLLWSYMSVQISDRTWEDRDVCGAGIRE